MTFMPGPVLERGAQSPLSPGNIPNIAIATIRANDTDQSGGLNRKEMAAAPKAEGALAETADLWGNDDGTATTWEVRKALTAFDANTNGKLDWFEVERLRAAVTGERAPIPTKPGPGGPILGGGRGSFPELPDPSSSCPHGGYDSPYLLGSAPTDCYPIR